jgi:TetR/AcrR family transcriptional repressor of nem operon
MQIPATAQETLDKRSRRSYQQQTACSVSYGQPMKDVKQPRALATRDRILAEAARLFALKGYHDTTLDELRSVAEVTTGAFFHHFASKEDLGFAVLDRHMGQRRQALDEIERRLPPPPVDDPLGQVFLRLDAIQLMVCQRGRRKGGCIIGNLSTALSDTHDGFRQRLAECFDEMAREFKPNLDAAVKTAGRGLRVDTWALAQYIVAIIEGSIMLTRTQRNKHIMTDHFDYLKEHLQQSLRKGNHP